MTDPQFFGTDTNQILRDLEERKFLKFGFTDIGYLWTKALDERGEVIESSIGVDEQIGLWSLIRKLILTARRTKDLEARIEYLEKSVRWQASEIARKRTENLRLLEINQRRKDTILEKLKSAREAMTFLRPAQTMTLAAKDDQGPFWAALDALLTRGILALGYKPSLKEEDHE
jgi:hypothetical protein